MVCQNFNSSMFDDKCRLLIIGPLTAFLFFYYSEMTNYRVFCYSDVFFITDC